MRRNASERLSSSQQQQIKRAIKRAALSVLSQEQSSLLVREVESLLGAEADTLENGFRTFSVSRFADTVIWFATRLGRLSKTKLAKLLWLSDFKHFRSYGTSLTGLVYARLPYGPAPHRFELLLGAAEELGVVRVEHERFGQFMGDAVVPGREADEEAFDLEESATLDFVLRKFGRYTATHLSDLTHREQAWLERSDGQFIPYSDANKLRIFD